MLAVQAEGMEVITIEGLAKDDVLDPLQEEFIEQGAIISLESKFITI